MNKIYYEKRGRRYVPVAEYDSEFLDRFPKGNHLVMCYPGGQSRKYNIEPNQAALIAAARTMEDTIIREIVKKSELKPSRQPLTPGQQKAWKNLQKEFGDDLCALHGVSVWECVQAGLEVLIAEAEEKMKHPEVQKAYEQYQMMLELAT